MRMILLSLCLLILLAGWPSRLNSQQDEIFQHGSIIIALRETARLAQITSLISKDIHITNAISQNIYRAQVPMGMENAYVQYLAQFPQVRYAQLDHKVYAQIEPDDPRYAEQWNMSAIHMPETWSTITDTTSLTVAILDTGIKTDHADLESQLWTNPAEIPDNGIDDDQNGYVDDIYGWHWYHTYSGGQAWPGEDNDVSDANGHGTHVSGIIGAAGNNGAGVAGVAWRARLMMLRVLDEDAVGWESDIIQGLNYAIDNGARVVNMSLGLSASSPALAEVIQRAEDHGVIVVAAAGNTGGSVLYPAAYPTVVSVGASDQTNARASFSAFGARLDLLAPGQDILSTWNGVPYFVRSGTSMAAPHVAGVAALVRVRSPLAGPAVVRACLFKAASDLGSAGRDDATGWGLLDATVATKPCEAHVYLPALEKSP